MRNETPRKPLIYLAVILPILGGGFIALVVALLAVFSALKGVPLAAVPNLNGFLICLPALILWIPMSFLLSNTVLYVVPPLRRIAEQHIARANRPGYGDSQKALLKIAGIFALVCIPLLVVGYIL